MYKYKHVLIHLYTLELIFCDGFLRAKFNLTNTQVIILTLKLIT